MKELILLLLLIWSTPAYVHAGRCTGSSSCRACKNCSSCKHCSVRVNSCGVCEGGYSSNYRSASYSSSSPSSSSDSSESGSNTWKYLLVGGGLVGGGYLMGRKGNH